MKHYQSEAIGDISKFECCSIEDQTGPSPSLNVDSHIDNLAMLAQ